MIQNSPDAGSNFLGEPLANLLQPAVTL
jgi:hypothetical protein